MSGPSIPLTFTGFMSSTETSVFSSGIAVSVSDLPFSEDAQKDDFFIQNEAVPILLEFSQKYWLFCCKELSMGSCG